jgi:hypothetical protein
MSDAPLWLGIAAVAFLVVAGSLVVTQATLKVAPIQIQGFLVYDPQPLAAGGPGCVATSGEVCFSIHLQAGSRNIVLSNVSFQVLNAEADAVVWLPPSSSIVVLASSSTVLAAWSPAYQQWETGGSVVLESSDSLVLDLGTTTDFVSGDWFVASAAGVGSSSFTLP